MTTLSQRLVDGLARPLLRHASSRRSFLGGSVLVGAALAVDPMNYLFRPGTAYASVCGSHSACADGYTVFCCTINAGRNSCPPDSFIGGWWKADNSSFCHGAARYYIDCNAYRDGHWACRCNQTTCDQRRVACNQFRYGQCNLQIPYSNTGPVVCRVISCVPPWQQYAGVCTSTSATDNATASHSAPCLTGVAPVGYVDAIQLFGDVVRITGWAFDPDQPAASINVAVYIDGVIFTSYPTNVVRADVNRNLEIAGSHGFVIPFRVPSGTHDIRVYALDIAGGSGNPLIGSKTVTVAAGHAPTGYLDFVRTTGNTVRLAGWAVDADQPGSALTVSVRRDGTLVSSATTSIVRPDVNRAIPANGAHGFDITLSAPNGPHEFVVDATGVGGGAAQARLGRAVIDVNPGAVPVGYLDAVYSVGTSVFVRGWAYDADDPGASLLIAVHEDGTTVSTTVTGRPRPDVNRRYGITGEHGFEIELPTTAGQHYFEVYALNRAGGPRDLLLGTRSMAVDLSTPLGHVDLVQVAGSELRVAGWAFDPDDPAASSQVAVYVDGAGLGWYSAALPRADINRVYGVGGDHGFDVRHTASAGRHTVTVYAINVGGVLANPLIGTGTVTI